MRNIWNWIRWILTCSKRKNWLINHYARYLDYETGFSGVGTTALDIEPDFSKPTRIPNHICKILEKESKAWADVKHDAMRKACIDVLGEDPNDW